MIYSKLELEDMSLAQLKAIAKELKATVTQDKRSKNLWMLVILRKQGNLKQSDFKMASGSSLVQRKINREGEWKDIHGG